MSKTKILALYLPQFHEISENNEWWGKGFTEWTSVKNARPIFKGHIQPKIPLDEDYYNLLSIETLTRQAKWMNEYGVDGVCMYHYWFKGKKLLEKPAELLLKNIEIPMNFCFSWANQTWSRTWYGTKKENLIIQEYGNKNDWESHFNYLLPFFKDDRYIKVDGSPVFVIYRPFEIHCYSEMIKSFKEMAIKNSFPGIHIIETLSMNQVNIKHDISDACFFYEPGYTLFGTNIFRQITTGLKIRIMKMFPKLTYLLNIFSYSKIYSEILSKNLSKVLGKGKKVYLGGFVKWDNTARRNILAYIFNDSSAQLFRKYIFELLIQSEKLNSEFIFLTAWNEWAEGAYLEPDIHDGFQYLQSIKEARNDFNNYHSLAQGKF